MSSVLRAGCARERREHLVRRVRVVERRDERLHQRHRAVVGARVAPAFRADACRGCSSARDSRRLVLIEAVVDDQADLAEPLGELDVSRRGEHRVVAEDDEQLDLTGLHRRRQLGERGVLADRLRLDRSAVSDCRADVSERLVHGVRERVHRCRLELARHDDRPAAVRLQVLGDGGDPLRLVRPRAPRPACPPAPTAAARFARKSFDIRRLHRQPVLGLGAGQRRRALDHVQPVHLLRVVGDAAAIGEIARVADHRRRRNRGNRRRAKRRRRPCRGDRPRRLARAGRLPEAEPSAVGRDRIVLMPRACG